jgi:hypothetical protein
MFVHAKIMDLMSFHDQSSKVIIIVIIIVVKQ